MAQRQFWFYLLLVLQACVPINEINSESLDWLKVIHTEPEKNSKNVLQDTKIKVFFNSLLDPSSIHERSFSISNGNSRKILLWIKYSPIESVVELIPRFPLHPNLRYKVKVMTEVTSLEGARLKADYEFFFFTGNACKQKERCKKREYIPPPLPLEPDYLKEIVPLFSTRCKECHGREKAMRGLILSDAEGIKETAIGKEAIELSNWLRIMPYKPCQSYLLYKLSDKKGLRGSSMPKYNKLGKEALIKISNWIEKGARTTKESSR